MGRPPIEAESELVEVGLKMLVADAVMDAGQPGLEVGKDEVDDRQILFCHLGIAPLGDGEMLVAALAKTGVTGPVVRVTEVPAATALSTKPQSAAALRSARWQGNAPARPSLRSSSLCRVCGGEPRRRGDQHLVRDAPAFSSRPTTDIAFIDFDVLAKPAANPILIWSNHTGTQLVQDLESGFVTRKPDLALELHGRHAGRLAGDQIGGPEPHAQRCMGTLHDRSSREANVAATVTAAQTPRPAGKTERFSSRLAIGAENPSRHRTFSRYVAHAASSGNSRWNSAATAETTGHPAPKRPCPSSSAKLPRSPHSTGSGYG